MAGETSIAELATRLGRGPEEFDALLASPDAWSFEDYVDVILGLFGGELAVRVVPVAETALLDPDIPAIPLKPMPR